ncbi:IclR family transcriptional regulator [Aeromicrobium sp. CF4.19]|uniref:IclR family transcriptional regulator n=1 Tax=Aeromicrobium sp. CF4.19 TaxID=3373082 RepID=UPI003EE58CED
MSPVDRGQTPALGVGALGGTEGATRVADVLMCFVDPDRTWGVTELAGHLGLPKAVVHRILQSLASRGLVLKLPLSRYGVGPSAEELASPSRRSLRMVRAAGEPMHALRAQTRETVVVSGLMGYSRVGLHQLLGPQEVNVAMALNRPRPLVTGATGAVMLALAGHELRELAIAWAARSSSVPPEIRAAHDDDRWREMAARGFVISERSGGGEIGAIAAPVLDGEFGAVGAITVIAPVHRTDTKRLATMAPMVVKAAAAATKAIELERRCGS